MEVQYLDNITKKNYLCSRRRLRRLGGLGGLGVVRQVRRVGRVRRVGVRAAPAIVGQVYTKEVAKCVYEELNKPMDVEETLKKLAEKMNNNQFTE